MSTSNRLKLTETYAYNRVCPVNIIMGKDKGMDSVAIILIMAFIVALTMGDREYHSNSGEKDENIEENGVEVETSVLQEGKEIQE